MRNVQLLSLSYLRPGWPDGPGCPGLPGGPVSPLGPEKDMYFVLISLQHLSRTPFHLATNDRSDVT